MIEVLDKIADGECWNCGEPIKQMRGDLTGPRWYHVKDGKRECPGTKYAVPEVSP